jgi:hypothetical protein
MKLIDVILFVSAMAFFVIGIHQGMTVGWPEAYSLFMISLAALFIYGYRKNARSK